MLVLSFINQKGGIRKTGSRVSIFPVMAMTASDTVIVPVKTERGTTDATIETIKLSKRYFHNELGYKVKRAGG